MAAALLVFRYRSLGMIGAEFVAHDLITALFWPIIVVFFVLGMLGLLDIE
jgi:hypothetical protein